MPNPPDHPRTVFHIAAAADWREAEAAGVYLGSPLCRRDGYVHMSTRVQVGPSLARFFQGRDDIVLLAAEVVALAPGLRWDEVPGKGTFPHHYGPLDVAVLRSLGPIALGPDGRHVLPDLPPEGDATDHEATT